MLFAEKSHSHLLLNENIHVSLVFTSWNFWGIMISPCLDCFSQMMAKSMWLLTYISLLGGKLELLIKWDSLSFWKLVFPMFLPRSRGSAHYGRNTCFGKVWMKGQKLKNTSGNWVLNKKNEDLLTLSLLSNSKFLWTHFEKATYRKSAASPKPCCWGIYSLRWHHSGHN